MYCGVSKSACFSNTINFDIIRFGLTYVPIITVYTV